MQDVSTDVCASGKHWAGDLTASEEMYPGYDCLACHRDYDGPELMAAGTIYGLLDLDGKRTTVNKCFGIEGASVTITAGDGQVLQTTTNRAGNFYFEGPASDLVKPLAVVVEYTSPEGTYSRQPMATFPSYGGCGRCHQPLAEGTPGAMAGQQLDADAIVPNVPPIFTGPVQQ